MESKDHLFMPGHTINAAIRKYNGYDLAPDELKLLQEQFNVLNENQVPRPGMKFKIPLLDRIANK